MANKVVWKDANECVKRLQKNCIQGCKLICLKGCKQWGNETETDAALLNCTYENGTSFEPKPDHLIAKGAKCELYCKVNFFIFSQTLFWWFCILCRNTPKSERNNDNNLDRNDNNDNNCRTQRRVWKIRPIISSSAKTVRIQVAR